MKVKSQTDKMIVIDLERRNKYTDAELDEFHIFDDLMLPRVLRIYEDRIEIVVDVAGRKKKTLKICYHDAILMNRVLHRICREKPDERS